VLAKGNLEPERCTHVVRKELPEPLESGRLGIEQV